MTTFRIYINGVCDIVKAKHIKEGYYVVKPNKTTNYFGIHWICTFKGDFEDKYDIASFYPTSKYANNYPEKSSVLRIAY